MTERRALELASAIVRQNNLCSTATEEQRTQTLSRLIDWWNFVALPLVEPWGTALPEGLQQIADDTVAELESHCRYPK